MCQELEFGEAVQEVAGQVLRDSPKSLFFSFGVRLQVEQENPVGLLHFFVEAFENKPGNDLDDSTSRRSLCFRKDESLRSANRKCSIGRIPDAGKSRLSYRAGIPCPCFYQELPRREPICKVREDRLDALPASFFRSPRLPVDKEGQDGERVEKHCITKLIQSEAEVEQDFFNEVPF